MKLLLIDDDAPLRKSLRLTLETMGHHVTEASDGEQVLGLLVRRSFDGVLLDICLGDEPEPDWLAHLLQLAPRLLPKTVEPAVILAAGDQVDVSDLPAQLGSTPRAAVEVGGRVTLEELEAEHLRRILLSTTSLDEAAKVLGIDPSTLYRKRKRYGL